jgi:hypothetical protein
VTAFVTAGAGFLLAVLWLDLIFDAQAIRHRGDRELPEWVLASVAGYYRRVTTEARPMSRLIAAVMAATIAALVVQLARGDVSAWVAVASLALVGAAVAVAATHTVPNAVRLGGRRDSAEAQTRLARSILRDHLLCAAAIAAALAVQLSVAA